MSDDREATPEKGDKTHVDIAPDAPRALPLYLDDQTAARLADIPGPTGGSVIWDLSTEEYRYARWGLVGGLVCVVIGAGLSLLGAGAATTAGWNVSVLGLTSSLTAATPGIVSMVVGVITTFLTRPTMRMGGVDKSRSKIAARGGGIRSPRSRQSPPQETAPLADRTVNSESR